MTLSELEILLSEQGFYCFQEADFGYFQDLTFARGRLICAEAGTGANSALTPFGISFWLHDGSGLVFLGLWSGRLFQLRDRNQLSRLTTSVLSGTYHPKGRAPWNLPADVIASYGLRACEIVMLAKKNNAERLDDAKNSNNFFPYTRSQFLGAMRPLLSSCKADADGFVFLEIGAACAMARFSGEKPLGMLLPVVLYDGVRETGDQVRLLHALEIGLGCAMYEDAWGGNRIHLDDPHYALPSSQARPDEPRNAWLEQETAS